MNATPPTGTETPAPMQKLERPVFTYYEGTNTGTNTAPPLVPGKIPKSDAVIFWVLGLIVGLSLAKVFSGPRR
jgi:hypothetical protein